MDFPATRAQLSDLPPSFRPPGNPYAQIVDAIAWALAQTTEGIDDIFASLYLEPPGQ